MIFTAIPLLLSVNYYLPATGPRRTTKAISPTWRIVIRLSTAMFFFLLLFKDNIFRFILSYLYSCPGFRLQSGKNICALESPASHIFFQNSIKCKLFIILECQWNSVKLPQRSCINLHSFFPPVGSIKCNQPMTVKSVYWESVSVVTNQINKSHQTLFSPFVPKQAPHTFA